MRNILDTIFFGKLKESRNTEIEIRNTEYRIEPLFSFSTRGADMTRFLYRDSACQGGFFCRRDDKESFLPAGTEKTVFSPS
jgi:hypothetical protein